MCKNVIWPPNIRKKLLQYRSIHFTPKETFEFITTLIIDIEELLKNDYISQTYTEEYGLYKGISRIVVRKFRIYYEKDINQNKITILAILFPGEK